MHPLRLNTISRNCLKGKVLYESEGGFIMNAALLAHSDNRLRVLVPRSLGATKLFLSITSAHTSQSATKTASWVALEREFDVYESVIDLPSGLYFYTIELETPNGEIFGYKGGDSVIFGTEITGAPLQLTVSDFKHALPKDFLGGIIYHVFVDRFARRGEPYAKPGTVIADYSQGIPEYPAYPGAPLKNNTFYGGTLYGVIDKLDHIASLGANIIYLSPIFSSPSNHKYDTADYMTVDEAFGGEAALRELIEAAHARGIKIILDGVFNHTGADSIYFNRYSTYDSLGAYQSKESPFYSWYDFKNHPNEYTCWWDIEILPRINTQNKHCADFFTAKGGVVRKYAKMGIDGLRLDVVDELGDNFVEEIKSALAEESDGSILYGEVWEDASNKIAYSTRKQYYLGSELDGVMNYPVRRGIIDYLTKGSTEELKYALTEVTLNAPERIMHAQMNLLGTHDTERILTVLSGVSAEGLENSVLVGKRLAKSERALATKRLFMAYTILATLPGIPTVFYGDEAGLEGYGDPFNRMPYPWHNEDKKILKLYKKIGSIRRKNAVYKDGSFSLDHLDRDLLVFTRKHNGDALVTVVNNSQSPITLSFSANAKALVSGKRGNTVPRAALSAEIFKICAEEELTVIA